MRNFLFDSCAGQAHVHIMIKCYMCVLSLDVYLAIANCYRAQSACSDLNKHLRRDWFVNTTIFGWRDSTGKERNKQLISAKFLMQINQHESWSRNVILVEHDPTICCQRGSICLIIDIDELLPSNMSHTALHARDVIIVKTRFTVYTCQLFYVFVSFLCLSMIQS